MALTESADLDELWKRVEARLGERFHVFPDIPLNEASMPEAEWPDADVMGFLDFADTLGVPVVYVVATRIKDLLEASSELQGKASPREDDLMTDLQAYGGRVRSIEVAFVHHGVFHRWETEAPWWRSLRAQADERYALEEAQASDPFGAGGEGESHNADQIEQWARLLAEAPGFQQAKTQTGREREARKLIAEIDRAIAESEHGHSSLAWRVVQMALDLYREEIVPRLDREMAPRARDLLAQGLRKYQAAARLNISVNRLNRILEQFPDQH